MSDTELTEPEADRLRQLLHRAADSLDVTVPDHVELQPTRTRPGPGRLLAAAAVLLVAALGAAWWISGDGEDRIDTGPAEPPVTVAPRVLEESGIWRLPEGLDGYRVVGAQDGGSVATSSVDNPGVLAVDDPDEPTRWLLVQAYDELGQLPPETRVVPLSDQVGVAVVPTPGSTWFRIAPTGDELGASGEQVVSGSALAIDEAELVDLLTEHLGSLDALASASSTTTSMEAMLDDAGFGDDRLVWQGDGDGAPGSGSQQLQITLQGGDTEVVVSISGDEAPAWAQVARLRMADELMSLSTAEFPSTVSRTIVVRDDLGPKVLESIYTLEGMGAIRTLAVVTDDGVLLSAAPSFPDTAQPATVPTLTTDEQLRIINSLRAMPEDEFRARLAELGAEFVEPDSMGSTTTMVGTPGG